MSAVEGLTLQLSVDCESCHQVVHVQGLTEQTVCAACQETVELPAERWVGWYEPSLVAEALTLEPGMARQISQLGGTSAKYALGRRLPRCQSCKTDVPLDDLERLAGEGGHTCACGERIAIREAPVLARLLIPGARWVVNEGPLGAGDEVPAGREPVVMQCMSCGGALRVDGSSRAVTCQFCNASNYLPDGLWLTLHPPRKVRTFFVVAEIGGVDRLTLEAERRPELVGRSGAAPPELLARLAASDDWNARRAVASNVHAPPDVLLSLAHDDDSDVREALASNPSCSPELLTILAKDDDSDVRERVAGNPSAPVELLRSMTSDSDYSVRRKLVANPALPADALMPWLAVETDSDVLESASRRDDLPVAVLRAWAVSDSYRMRQAAAKHPSTPPDLLLALASDHDSDVLAALVTRPELDARTILALAGREEERIRTLAASHPAYGPARSARLKRRLMGAGVAFVLFTCVGGVVGVAGLVMFVAQRFLGT